MNKKFIARVLRERMVTTSRYRYSIRCGLEEGKRVLHVVRLPIKWLGKSEMLNPENWEVVYESGH